MGSLNTTLTSTDRDLRTVEVDDLKKLLNTLYKARGVSSTTLPMPGLFEYLWDLKEIALLEGKPSVQVPENWWEELEAGYASVDSHPGTYMH